MHYYHLILNYIYLKIMTVFLKTTTLEPLRHKKPDVSKIRFLEVPL